MQNKPEPAFSGQYFETLLPTATACLALPSPVIGLGAVRLPKTAGKIPSRIYAPVKEWQKRATLGAVFGAPSTAPNPPL